MVVCTYWGAVYGDVGYYKGEAMKAYRMMQGTVHICM